MRQQLIIIFLATTILFSCDSKSNDYVSPNDLAKIPDGVTTTTGKSNDTLLNQLLQSNTNSKPLIQGSNSTTNTPAPVSANTTSTQVIQAVPQPVTPKAGANPAHGQPGHRCDIPVGAPLNSPAAKTQPTTLPATAVATPVKTKTAPGMNPQHGEPGHRCDISVGAPLNSPVAKPAAVTTPAVIPTTSATKADSSGQ